MTKYNYEDTVLGTFWVTKAGRRDRKEKKLSQKHYCYDVLIFVCHFDYV